MFHNGKYEFSHWLLIHDPPGLAQFFLLLIETLLQRNKYLSSKESKSPGEVDTRQMPLSHNVGEALGQSGDCGNLAIPASEFAIST